jgi:site-specific DNA-cytosine methylase
LQRVQQGEGRAGQGSQHPRALLGSRHLAEGRSADVRLSRERRGVRIRRPARRGRQSDQGQEGREFKRFVKAIRALGYRVQWKILKACDYGAPTSRKRLYMVMRCDGLPIVWPKATHGAPARLQS